MKAIQVTTAYARNDDEWDFDELDELVDATGYELDDETNEDDLLAACENEDHPPYVYADAHTGCLRWTKTRARAVDAITEEGDDADDGDAEGEDD